jgi:hypothetical protein
MTQCAMQRSGYKHGVKWFNVARLEPQEISRSQIVLPAK